MYLDIFHLLDAAAVTVDRQTLASGQGFGKSYCLVLGVEVANALNALVRDVSVDGEEFCSSFAFSYDINKSVGFCATGDLDSVNAIKIGVPQQGFELVVSL